MANSNLEGFTADISKSFPGPNWLSEIRNEAYSQLDHVEAPNTEEEVWRYSRVNELNLGELTPNFNRPENLTALPIDRFSSSSATVVLQDGWVSNVTIEKEAEEDGVIICPVGDLEDGIKYFGAALEKPVDLFGYLNRAFGPEPLVVVVPKGIVVKGPIVIVSLTDTSEAVFPRIMIHCEENSEVKVVEVQTSSNTEAVISPVLEVTVGQAARYSHCVVQNLGARTWQFSHQAVDAGKDASAEFFIAGIGGEYVRTRTDCRLTGRGAFSRINAAYFGEDDQTMDFRTFQDHISSDTTSDLLFKGALGDSSRSIYSGLTKIRPEASRIRANQTNRNIKLDPEAWAESIPNLEIENNDVVCSHASTVSPVDEDELFYIESRGVPTPVAERLILEGFFNEIISSFPVEEVSAILQEAIVGKLDRRTLDQSEQPHE